MTALSSPTAPAPAARQPAVPRRGDIVSCRFPLDEQPRLPGPKARPALVLNVRYAPDLHTWLVLVAYGTSKIDARRGAGDEFTLTRPESLKPASLHQPTKFVVSRYRELPFDNDFFQFNRHQTAVLGSLAPHDRVRLEELCTHLSRRAPRHFAMLAPAA